MTLVLTLVTPEYVLQVSDRQLSYLDGSVAESNRNKVVVWPPNLLFSFTGLGHIAGQPTDMWLFSTLTQIKRDSCVSSVDQLFEELAVRANRAFDRIIAGPKSHCFVVSGWVELDDEQYAPLIATISNALDNNGNWISAPRKFTVRKRILDKTEWYLLEVTGQDIHIQAKRLIRRQMSRPTSPMAATKLLLTVLQVEAACNPLVGSRALIVSVPKAVIRQPRVFVDIAPPSERNASVWYVGTEGEDDQWGPPFVDRLAGYHISPLTDDHVHAASKPPDAAILTARRLTKNDWGNASWAIAVSEDYGGRGRSWEDITGAEVSPKGYSVPHPYYGLLVALRLSECHDNVIDEIRKDKRHFVILSNSDNPLSLPDTEWIEGLRDWLMAHGMRCTELRSLCEHLRELTLEQIVIELNKLLRTPAAHLDCRYPRTGE